MSSTKEYPTVQVRLDAHTKQEFFAHAKLKGTTPSAMIKSFIQTELAGSARLARSKTHKPIDDFLR